MKQLRGTALWPFRTFRLWLGGLLVSVVLGTAPGDTAAASTPKDEAFPGKLTLHNETLAARVTAVPLGQVMASLSRLSGAHVVWRTPRDEKPVSVEFPALPFVKALTRILREKNFMLFYTPTREGLRLSQIWISSRATNQTMPLLKSRSEAAGMPIPPPVEQLQSQPQGIVDRPRSLEMLRVRSCAKAQTELHP